MLSPSLLELLRDYYREARPAGWLFPGRNRIDPISTRQFNRAFGAACDFAEVKKKISPHTLCSLAKEGKLAFFGSLSKLADPDAFATYLAPLRKISWVVYAK